ncbi:MAG: hypothetical protein IPP88_18090 [Betaproteobacteria bacterium]|nr:hypothetical protein [Betaproteobacteria bacterium]
MVVSPENLFLNLPPYISLDFIIGLGLGPTERSLPVPILAFDPYRMPAQQYWILQQFSEEADDTSLIQPLSVFVGQHRGAKAKTPAKRAPIPLR